MKKKIFECGKCKSEDFIAHKFINFKPPSMFLECENCEECFKYDFEKHAWISKEGVVINEKIS